MVYNDQHQYLKKNGTGSLYRERLDTASFITKQ